MLARLARSRAAHSRATWSKRRRRAPARLRPRRARAPAHREGWPDPDAIVITHFHLDHWGDLVPWVWGALHLRRARAGAAQARSSGCRPAGAPGSSSSAGCSDSPTCSSASSRRSSTRRGRLRRGRLHGHGNGGAPLHRRGLRAPGGGRRAARSPIRATRAPPTRSPRWRERPTSSSARRPCSAGDADGEPRGHLSLEEAQRRLRGLGGEGAPDHPPAVRARQSPTVRVCTRRPRSRRLRGMLARVATAPIELIEGIPLFAGLDRRELKAVAESLNERDFPPARPSSRRGRAESASS